MKSEGRKATEKAIMDKIQSVFDNADRIDEFEIKVHGSVDEVTTIEYTVSEQIVP